MSIQNFPFHSFLKSAIFFSIFPKKKNDSLIYSYTKAGENMKNGKLAFFNLFNFACVAALNSQMYPFLKDTSLSYKAFILGLGALLSLVLAILIGKKVDQSGSFKKTYQKALGFYSFTFLLAFLSHHILLQFLAFVGAQALVKQVMTLNETWTFMSEPKKFGFYHCMAAIGLVLGSLLCGYLREISLLYFLLFYLFCAFWAFFLSIQLQEEKKEVTVICFHDFQLLFKNRAYMMLLGVLFLLMMVGYADQFVVLDKLVQLEKDSLYLTYKFAIQSFIEIPFYLLYTIYFKKFSSIHLLIFAAFMSSIKFGLYGLSEASWQILGISLLQGVTHPLIVVSSKQLIAKITPSFLSSSTQIVGFAIYFGLSGFFSSLISLYLLPKIGSSHLLLGFSLMAFVAFLMTIGMKKSGKYDTLETGE